MVGVEDEQTDPAICVCETCTRQAEIERAFAKAGGAKVQTIFNPLAAVPYIVTVTIGDRFTATGHGQEEGEGIYAALQILGLVQ